MIVYTGGTFDLFHAGHVEFLARCRQLAGSTMSPSNRVVVGLNQDEFVEQFKGQAPVVRYELRAIVLNACAYVDEVTPNDGGPDSTKAIERVNPDLVVIGSDWHDRDYLAQMNLTWEFMHNHGVSLAYVPRVTPISSTKIKERMR
jgi:glycerol-3-phosphate cytidylyltransferase